MASGTAEKGHRLVYIRELQAINLYNLPGCPFRQSMCILPTMKTPPGEALPSLKRMPLGGPSQACSSGTVATALRTLPSVKLTRNTLLQEQRLSCRHPKVVPMSILPYNNAMFCGGMQSLSDLVFMGQACWSFLLRALPMPCKASEVQDIP